VKYIELRTMKIILIIVIIESKKLIWYWKAKWIGYFKTIFFYKRSFIMGKR